MTPVAVNTLGELYIGGPGVFAGYLGDNDTIRALNRKSLVRLPGYGKGELCYRTGDLCRLSSEGAITYAGRIDHQVKIRGQRLELGEVEASLIDPDVTACAVVKHVNETTNEEYLAAYIQAAEHVPSSDYDEIRARILARCEQSLPAFMVPAAWLIMKKLPLNSSDKIDRKQLPKISCTVTSTSTPQIDPSIEQEIAMASFPLPTLIEAQLHDIFCQALDINIDRNQLDTPFGHLGGTSITAMTIVTLIRRRLYKPMDVGLLFEHSSVRQLAKKLLQLQQPQLEQINEAHRISTANETVIDLDPSNTVKPTDDNNDQDVVDDRSPLSPSLLLETIGVLLLVYHYLYPSWISLKIIELVPIQNYLFEKNSSATFHHYWIASSIEFSLLFSLVPTIQLVVYLICKWLLLGRIKQGKYRLYSWRYYCHWFVHRLWVFNSPQLTAMVGTPVYNLYLRMCGAHIGRNVHINTILIDTPDLLSVDDHTYISNGVTLASLSYGRRMYRLDRVQIGNNCSMQARCVLQHGVCIRDNVLVKSMSFVSGVIPANSTVDGNDIQCNNRAPREYLNKNLSFNWLQIGYQGLCVFFVYVLQIIVPLTAFATYLYLFPEISSLYFFVCLPILWIIRQVFNAAMCTTIFLVIIGRVRGSITHPVNSWYYIHKLWFRQLVGNTLGSSFSLFGLYHRLYRVVLRWLGARLGSDVSIADFGTLLSGPPNLITAGNSLTTNSGCLIVPVDVVDGECTMRQVDIGDKVTLGNVVTIDGGAHIPDRCMIGSMTRVNANEQFNNDSILLGVPARELPISNASAEMLERNSQRALPWCLRTWRIFLESFLQIVLAVVIGKLLVAVCGVCFIVYVFIDIFADSLTLTNIFLLLPPLYIIFMVLFSLAFCHCYRRCNHDIWHPGVHPFEKWISWRRHLIWYIMTDYYTFAATFLGGTQWLVILLRGSGARIGRNVILSDFYNLIDLQLITIEDYVRMNSTAIVQVSLLFIDHHVLNSKMHKTKIP